MISTSRMEELEQQNLKPYACFSKGAKRKIRITQHPIRTEFQRDRDRILHSKAFRRLEYKTQVFVTKRGDHARTRLTHSLEVAQLSRTAAVQLGLNSDLVEAIALGHDLGHTPFGHAGERALRKVMQECGIRTFKHNVQSVRIVEMLEKKYSYDGIALTLPVREGILKHTSLPSEIPDFCKDLYVDKSFSVTLEGQVVAIVDEIAQITHDMDDYLRYNIISFDEFLTQPIFSHMEEFYNGRDINFKEYLVCDNSRKKDTLIRCLVDFLMTKLIEHSEKNLEGKDELRAYEIDDTYIKFNDVLYDKVKEFKDYIDNTIKTDFRIEEMDKRGANIITKLFEIFRNNPDFMPTDTKEKYDSYNINENVNVIADYISGMTDRYAIEQYELLYGVNVR